MDVLQEKEWKAITLEEIFDIKSGKRLENRNKIEGDRPFIGATDNNNGVTGFVANENSSLDKNTLGVNYNGAPCIAFYHPYKCIFTDDVKHLHFCEHEDTQEAFLAFISIFAKQKCKYNYGYKFNENRMRRQKLFVPADEKGEPDYEFMEHYISEKWGGLIMRYKAFLKNQLAELEHVDIPALSEKEWKGFSIENIANVHGTTTTQPKDLQAGGKNPRVTCAATNNALDNFFYNETTETGNVLTVDSATIGTVFYQAYDFIATDHVEVIDPEIENMNLYIGLFLSLAVQHSCGGKYMYGYKFSQQRIKRQTVMLPTTNEGEPDWDYMEQYAKNLMLKKYQQYLQFLEGQGS